MHPAVVIFLSVVLVQAITALGKQRLEDILWFGYISIFHRRTLSTQRTLRREIYTTKQQLSATSSQDQFAKWAKLRRKVDKSLADLERTNSTLASSRTTFNMLLKGFLFVLTTVMPFCVTSWYSKTPIFWLPPGEHSWFGPLGWFLALPRAPRGAVSSTVWQMVCSRSLIALGGALANLVPGKKEEVVNEAKIQELHEEEKGAQGASAPASASPAAAAAAAAASGDARRRTNATASSASEKQYL
ncbi:hypothetical protein EX895_001039 [Sporisorium graminicola]|uniref:Uncharacterized protein n=1 Tax=Sporisorium graminicola TaxID=280036 RepID=A0A4U7L2K7_9BASI|nr:hypothetical protein EX895_001039 [Sporisorium graminicola]TKY91040.1 hypothetical protein EX895_001039 [Sporisorium graminicola]